MRPSEESCKNAFDAFLKLRYSQQDIVWDPGSEPPDAWLILCGIRYAVEIRHLYEKYKCADLSRDQLDVDKPILDFLKSVENESIEHQILNGTYVVYYTPVFNFGHQKRFIKREIVSFLTDTRNVNIPTNRDIVIDDSSKWEIKKLNSEKHSLLAQYPTCKWGQPLDDLRALIKGVLDEKVKKLSMLSEPKILIINNAYPWVRPTDWSKCLSNLDNLSKFHTVFLVSHMEEGNFILYTAEHAWLK